MKPFSYFTLYLYIYIGLCIGTYSFHGQKRDPNLLRPKEVVPLKKHIKTSDLGLIVWIFPLFLLYFIG